jgi:hypothetical protein
VKEFIWNFVDRLNCRFKHFSFTITVATSLPSVTLNTVSEINSYIQFLYNSQYSNLCNLNFQIKELRCNPMTTIEQFDCCIPFSVYIEHGN